MSKFLIVGLGNIGDEYNETRHNIGFKVVDYLAADSGVKFTSERYADVAQLKYKGKQLILIKPNTFMNLSGKAVNYWLQSEKIEIENTMVIVDDLALPFGKIRIGPKGGDGGHNGLKSIQETLNTANYPRLRFGISNEFNKGAQVNYVLGEWNEEELKTLNDRIKIAADAVKAFSFIGLPRCMNEFNNK
ncbi:MAG: aminoacyl-tRNA hydrolase [Bacteroidota bacterium]|nr:aminoacyl-tRNA hydrolase [Bacteroidota bacterium]MDP3146262.1 aminoacyl-tRNA hydrolase [Bacteroidota bacterium]